MASGSNTWASSRRSRRGGGIRTRIASCGKRRVGPGSSPGPPPVRRWSGRTSPGHAVAGQLAGRLGEEAPHRRKLKLVSRRNTRRGSPPAGRAIRRHRTGSPRSPGRQRPRWGGHRGRQLLPLGPLPRWVRHLRRSGRRCRRSPPPGMALPRPARLVDIRGVSQPRGQPSLTITAQAERAMSLVAAAHCASTSGRAGRDGRCRTSVGPMPATSDRGVGRGVGQGRSRRRQGTGREPRTWRELAGGADRVGGAEVAGCGGEALCAPTVPSARGASAGQPGQPARPDGRAHRRPGSQNPRGAGRAVSSHRRPGLGP